MTKDQKVESALATIKEARRWHTRDEYVAIIKDIWDGLDKAKLDAVDGAPKDLPDGLDKAKLDAVDGAPKDLPA